MVIQLTSSMSSPLALLVLVVTAFAVKTLQSPLAPIGDVVRIANEERNSSSVLFRKKRDQEVSCGYVNAVNRIKNGTVTDIADFPWTALLFFGDGKSSIPSPRCGGVLISQSVVLTAAHCLLEGSNKKNLIFVRLGEYDLNADLHCIEDDNKKKECFLTQVDCKPNKIIIHPVYKSNTDNHHDIALIHLEIPVNYSPFVLPICLPDQSFEVSIQRNFTVAGWGRTDRFRSQGSIPSPIKLSEELQLFDWQACQQVYRSQITLGRGQLCAGGELNKDTCKGDSGSPLMTIVDGKVDSYWMLVGLVSLGPTECGTEGKPGIYTNVKQYVDWIEENMDVDV